jgi:SAM-dependent methyltransferase
MENVKSGYTQFHLKKASRHLYPTEWVIRTMLGSYPQLKLDKSNYAGGKILDLGFGDGRNMSLLFNCGLQVYGVEITEETIELGKKNMEMLQVTAELKVGTNREIPFDDQFFDYILASSSCYYVDGDSSFDDNMKEISRVLKPGGTLIANFPAFIDNEKVPVSFILENATRTEDDHVIIQNDIYGIRNGYKFKAFDSKEQIENYFSRDFQNVSVGVCMDNYYGVEINQYILTAQKK